MRDIEKSKGQLIAELEELRKQLAETQRYDDGISVFVKDTTERRNYEKEMARLGRLNLIGQMAAGIGHEVRNPMTTVRGFLQMFGGKGEFSKYKAQLDLMIEELDRANSIITEFLSLAKINVIEKKMKNINAVVEVLLPLIQADAIKDDIYVLAELGEIPDLLLDENEIRQLIHNLTRNGIEAMPDGGNLTIKTLMVGQEIVLSIQDQGKGISPDALNKIGTPFFTTKEKGTGLGLATCYNIAARHTATIDINTNTSGTTFKVRFKE